MNLLERFNSQQPWKKLLGKFKTVNNLESSQNKSPKQGLVIAAGGTRTTFQIGALLYLYDVAGIEPEVITGCSAGSVIASLLAQSRKHEQQKNLVHEIAKRWQAVQDSEEIFVELDWFKYLKNRAPQWLNLLGDESENQSSPDLELDNFETETEEELIYEKENTEDFANTEDSAEFPQTRQTLSYKTTDTADTSSNSDLGESIENTNNKDTNNKDTEVGLAGSGNNILASNYEPPEDDTKENGWVAPGIFRALFSLGLTRIGSDISTLVRGVTGERAMFEPGVFTDKIQAPDIFDPLQVAKSGVSLRLVVVSLESGKLRYVTEQGYLVERDGTPVKGRPRVSLRAAIRASCSIPGAIKPTSLAKEYYVDGGVREKLPVRVAVEQLGATDIWCIGTSGRTLPVRKSFAKADLVSVLLRSGFDIMDDEIAQAEYLYALEHGAKLIYPEVDVHHPMAVNPGTTKISMDYGWARAAEVHTKASSVEQACTRKWFLARQKVWQYEEEIFKPRPKEQTNSLIPWFSNDPGMPESPTPTTEQVQKLLRLKNRVKAAVATTPSQLLPPGAKEWHLQYEGHNFPIKYSVFESNQEGDDYKE